MTTGMSDPTDPSSSDTANNGLGDRGGVRGDAFPVEIVITLGDDSVAGATVTFVATDTVSATTDGDGVASTNLPAGDYTVTATSNGATATTSITVVPSTDPLIATLSLG
jgi:hypothetical protein